MPHHTSTLWPSILHFEIWFSRNCTSCRYRDRPFEDSTSHETCSFLGGALSSYIKSEMLPDDLSAIIFGTSLAVSTPDDAHAPFMCKSRKDKRGRHSKHL